MPVKGDTAELLFATRWDFRRWLMENAATSEGVWLIFGKKKEVATLSAIEALEEALCFGWVDGLMNSIDDTRYRKYFARRRPQSPWSDQNKKLVLTLRERKLMTEAGEQAIENAVRSGMWDASPSGAITDEQMNAFMSRLLGFSPAYENFCAMPPSAKTAYARGYLSAKKEETRQKRFEEIVGRLNQNLRPSIEKRKERQDGCAEG